MQKLIVFPDFPAFRSRDFRIFWIALFISNTGSQMQFVALNWQIYTLTNSAFALGLIGLLRFIPILIFSLLSGSVADAHNRKIILTITQTALIILSSILAFLTITNTVTVNAIYTITALSAIALAFDTPARQAFIPNLVDQKHLASAMSLNSIMFQMAMIFGPMFSGILIAQSGLGTIYILNTLSFLTVLASLYFIHTSGHIVGTPTQISLHSMKEGLHFVKSKTMIWSTMLLDFFSTFFSSAIALIPIFARDILAVGPTGLGMLYAAPAIGAVTAGFFIARKATLRHQGILLLGAVALYALGTILFGFSQIFILSFLALVIVGVGDSISTIIRNTIRQLETPDYIRGRMTGVNMIFFMGGPQLGDFEAGLLASLIGAPLSVITGGVGTLVVVGIMAATIPLLRRYDQHTTKS
ncbi:MAG: MFS transporter [Candidatus Levybacteria bacterium]|nr:MFS transporter [Candidatus Levybacteria bacterium]